jgi:serine phosphatase RsbU (regulator of sigma subunit)/anti-sigma regulatory factor (Ser/Thr protein kinase)
MQGQITGKIERLTIAADYEQIAAARECFRQVLIQVGLEEEERHHWLVVFSEGLTNAIEHGARGDKTQQIQISWIIMPSEITVSLSDPGLGFIQKDSSTLLKTRGYGLRLIEHFCDRVEHLVNPAGGYTLKLSKIHNNLLLLPEAKVGSAEIYERFYKGMSRGVSMTLLIRDIINQLDIECATEIKIKAYVEASYLQGAIELGIYAGEIPPKTDRADIPIYLGDNQIGVLEILPKGLPTKALENAKLLSEAVAIGLEQQERRRMRAQQQEAQAALSIAARLQSRQRKLREASKEMPGEIKVFEKRASSVAGDIIEYSPAPDGGSYLLIADVMGKGVAAAFLAAILRGGWHLLSKQQSHPLLLIKELNSYLYDELNGQSMFATAALAHISPQKQRISIVNAGHTHVFVQKRTGLKAIESSGPPLGLFEAPHYELESLSLIDIERLYMPTDGLYCHEAGAVEAGEKNLQRIIAAHGQLPVEQLWRELQQRIASADSHICDDQSMLVWQQRSQAKPPSSSCTGAALAQ